MYQSWRLQHVVEKLLNIAVFIRACLCGFAFGWGSALFWSRPVDGLLVSLKLVLGSVRNNNNIEVLFPWWPLAWKSWVVLWNIYVSIILNYKMFLSVLSERNWHIKPKTTVFRYCQDSNCRSLVCFYLSNWEICLEIDYTQWESN